MKVKNLVTVAIMAALSIILGYFKVYQLPNGGSISLYLVPLFYVCYTLKFRDAFFITLIVAILQIILGGYIIGFFQAFLDYIFPVVFVSVMYFGQNKSLVVRIILLIILFVLMLSSYVISGMIYFKIPFIGAVLYNISFLIPTLIVNFIVIEIIRRYV